MGLILCLALQVLQSLLLRQLALSSLQASLFTPPSPHLPLHTSLFISDLVQVS